MGDEEGAGGGEGGVEVESGEEEADDADVVPA